MSREERRGIDVLEIENNIYGTKSLFIVRANIDPGSIDVTASLLAHKIANHFQTALLEGIITSMKPMKSRINAKRKVDRDILASTAYPLSSFYLPMVAWEYGPVAVVMYWFDEKRGFRNVASILTLAESDEPSEIATALVIGSDTAIDIDLRTVKKLMIKGLRPFRQSGAHETLLEYGYGLDILHNIRPVIVINVSKESKDKEIRVRISDGPDKISLTLKLRKPEWDLSSFPRKLVEDVRTIIIEPKLEERSYAVRGLLITGPPGVGKSVLAEAIANELRMKVLDLAPGSYRSMWYGATEKILQAIFSKLSGRKDVMVLLDDAEFLSSRVHTRHEAHVSEISTFLKILQSKDRPLIVATANNPNMIDPALLRPGRLDAVVVMGYPSREFRELSVRKLVSKYGIKISEDMINTIVRGTRWFTQAELDALIRLASMKGKGTITEESYEWARKRFNIDERERERLQEFIRWYIPKLQGIIISHVPSPSEV